MLKSSAPRFLLGLLPVLCLWSSCATPQQTYVRQHPELSAEHRRIIAAGKFNDRDPVAGMTRAQVRGTMGLDPTQITAINGEDAWIWIKRKGDDLTMVGETNRSGSGGSGTFGSVPRGSDAEPQPRVMVRTTVFFQGNLATRVDVTEEPLEARR